MQNHNDETNDFRRKDDLALAELLGEFKQWKSETTAWREGIEREIKEIKEFVSDFRSPSRAILWAVRAFVIASLGLSAKALFSFIKDHIRWN